MKKGLIVFMLAIAILLTMQGVPTGFETVKAVQMPENSEKSTEEAEIRNQGETESIEFDSLNSKEQENLRKNVEFSKSKKESTSTEVLESIEEDIQENNNLPEDVENLSLEEAKEELFSAFPANPVHHCTKKNDGTDTTDWSYIYFGSYPQTEITGSALTSDIIGAIYDENGDTWINGTKYRRITKNDTNSKEYFDESKYRYFKWERIKWRVLQNDGSTLFVIADKGLDCKNYHESETFITWEKSTLRNWLNSKFCTTAFSDREQNAIVKQTVVNEDNPSYHTSGGQDTTDKIYILSIGEAENSLYGFCNYGDTYSASRWMQTSDYAHMMGACTSDYEGYEGNCYWWLRSPGRFETSAAQVLEIGDVDRSGPDVNFYSRAVVPALHIDFSSNCWHITDDGTSGEGGSGGNGGSQSTDVGNAKVSCKETKEIKVGKEDFLFLNIHGDRESELDAVRNIAEIIINDTSVLSVEKGSLSKGLPLTSAGATDAIWILKLKGVKPGKAKIEVKLNGVVAASCDVTVTTSAGKSPIPVDSNDPSQVAKAVAFQLGDYMSDIEGESATIKGPEMDIFGKKFNLFEIDASTKIGTDKLKTEVSYDVEKKLVKVLIGVSTSGKAGIDGTTDNRMCNASWSEEYNQFKNLYKQMTGLETKKSNGNGTYWNQYEKLKGKMNRFQCKLMVDANMRASGYMEWSYETGELKFFEGGFVERATLGMGFKQYIPEIPLAYWFVNVTADEKGNFLFKKAGEMIAADFALEPSLAAEIGVGMGKSEGKYKTYLEASMDAILAAKIANLDPKLAVTLTGNLHARGYAIGHKLLDETYSFPKVQLYPGGQSKARARATAISLGDADSVYENAEPLSRDYLNGVSAALESDAAGAYLYWKTNTFPYCEPHLFALSGGRYLLLYIGDDGTKAQNNRTSLMYALYDGKNWSDEAKLGDSGTYMDGISAYQDGDKVYVTYRKAKQAFSDSVELKDIASSLDIWEVTFDGTSFGTPVCINQEANSVMESGQMVYSKNGEITVAWMENSENDIFLASGTNSLYMRTIKNGVLQNKVTAVSGTSDVISEINLGKIAGKRTLVYSVIRGADMENVTVYSYVNGSASQILSTFSAPGEYEIKGGNLYFLSKDTLYRYDGSTVCEEAGISGINNYRIVEAGGILAVVANVPTSYGSELYIAEKNGGSWGIFRPFTNQRGYIRDYDVLWDGKTVKAAINRLEPDESEAGKYNEASLLVTGEEKVYDIAADYIYYEENAVSPGKGLPLEIGFTNQGKDSVTKVNLVLKDGAGKQVGRKDVPLNLKAGESGTVTLNYVLPANLADKKLWAELSISEEETDSENNTVSTEIHYIDLAVKDAKCAMTGENTLLVTGTVINQGLEDINNVSTGLYYSNLSGEKLDECKQDVLKAGESMEFKSVLPGDMTFSDDSVQMGGLMVYAQSDAEERNYANNEARIVYNSKGEQTNPVDNGENPANLGGGENDTNTDIPVTTPSDGDSIVTPPSDESQSVAPPLDATGTENTKPGKIKVKKLSISGIFQKIAFGKKISLKVSVSPKNASNPKVTWKTSNKKYATVNSKGVVTTKKAGKGKTVKITAEAKDGSGKKATYKIKIMKNAVTKVQIKAPGKTLKAGKSMTLKATVKTNGKNANKSLKWTVSNKKYASVNSKGKVTAKKAGKGKTVTVTAMSTDGTNKKARIKIKIK